nr:VCBS repeat-containing protein [candidate division Zixibacteria bacterium]
MSIFFNKKSILFIVAIIFIVAFSGSFGAAIVADHNAVGEFDNIPDSVIQEITAGYHIYYAHTSHGSQIVTGIDMVYDENSLYESPYFYERGDDLGHTGDTSWAPHARYYLDNHPECNMVMFSWCGGCSDNNEEGIAAYLAKMEELEAAYPGAVFIYMTGHLDGSGPDGILYTNNNQIRDYCTSHDKVLFDFADIESYDPDGNYYPDETDACYWCSDWCAVHTCPTCGSCAHSHCFNCYLKGKAWWWMMAQVEGWNEPGDSIPEVETFRPSCNDVGVDTSFYGFGADFDLAMDPATFTSSSVVLHSSLTGRLSGTINYYAAGNRVEFERSGDFIPGEKLTALLTDDIHSDQGGALPQDYLWSFCISPGGGTGSFVRDTLYAGWTPADIYTGDFDNDGDIDIAGTGFYQSSNVSLMINDGNGGFTPGVTLTASGGPETITAGDFDNDGDLDLVIANVTAGNVAVFMNNGDATFALPVYYIVCENPHSVHTGDFNGDGRPDLVTGSFYDEAEDFAVILNNGDGTFSAAAVYEVDKYPLSIAVSDLDNDHDLDLAVVLNYDSYIAIYTNDGDGYFTSSIILNPGTLPGSIVSFDLNGDGYNDIAAGTGNSVVIFINDGMGDFSTPVNYAVSCGSKTLVGGDFDADGDIDLASGSTCPGDWNHISVLLNDGDGTFEAYSDYGDCGAIEKLCTADFDNDGDLDLANADFGAGFMMYLNHLCGDANGSGAVNMLDATFLISYLYRNGEVPDPYWSGDCNYSGAVNILDVTYLINYMYRDGPKPICP